MAAHRHAIDVTTPRAGKGAPVALRRGTATSLCGVLAFSCCDAWHAAAPRGDGSQPSLAEALELARAIAGPVLREPVSDGRPQ